MSEATSLCAPTKTHFPKGSKDHDNFETWYLFAIYSNTQGQCNKIDNQDKKSEFYQIKCLI